MTVRQLLPWRRSRSLPLRHRAALSSECSCGRFERRIPLPEEINPDKVEASFKNGVLTVVLPKNPQAQQPVRRIALKAA